MENKSGENLSDLKKNALIKTNKNYKIMHETNSVQDAEHFMEVLLNVLYLHWFHVLNGLIIGWKPLS